MDKLGTYFDTCFANHNSLIIKKVRGQSEATMVISDQKLISNFIYIIWYLLYEHYIMFRHLKYLLGTSAEPVRYSVILQYNAIFSTHNYLNKVIGAFCCSSN